MASPEAQIPSPAAELGTAAPGVGSGAWLGSRSVFDAPDPALRRRARNAAATSIAIHVILGALLIFGFIKRAEIMQVVDDTKSKIDVVYLESKGPGGGGGGSP